MVLSSAIVCDHDRRIVDDRRSMFPYDRRRSQTIADLIAICDLRSAIIWKPALNETRKTKQNMSLDLKPTSDLDGWTPPDSSTMQVKFTNIDQISDIPNIGSDPDPADLMNAIAEADRQQKPEHRKGKRRQALSTAALVAGPTSRRKRKRIVVGKRKRKAVKDDLDALSTIATVDGPVFPRKTINRRNRQRILKSNSKKIPLSAARKMIKASKGGIWVDSRFTLHSLISKITWAKAPLVQLLKR